MFKLLSYVDRTFVVAVAEASYEPSPLQKLFPAYIGVGETKLRFISKVKIGQFETRRYTIIQAMKLTVSRNEPQILER